MATPTTSAKFFAVLNRYLRDNNKTTVNPGDYETPVATPYTGIAYQRNTVVHLDPPESSNSAGRTSVFLDRIDMSTMTNISVEKGTATTFLELLPAIRTAVGMEFVVGDFEQVSTIPASGTMTITASNRNLVYFGAFTFTLVV